MDASRSSCRRSSSAGWSATSLGALAAYKGGWFDRGAFLGSLFLSSDALLLPGDPAALPACGAAFRVLPTGGGYSSGLTPELTSAFMTDALRHYWLPFLSLVLIFIGGQAVGMRSMAIYELNSDYVNYGRGLGLPDRAIVRYIFRNAMLPQVTGLALSIGTPGRRCAVTEIVFSYPGHRLVVVQRHQPERLPGDPGGHPDHRGRRPRRELPRRGRLRLRRSAHPRRPGR